MEQGNTLKRCVLIVILVLNAAVVLGLVGGCSPAHYKKEADEEVSKIIDSKWDKSFGQKANYSISDVTPSANDLQVGKEIPSSGVLTLAQAVAIATAHNRDYQRSKEELYEVALGLTLERHQYTLQWFGTIDAEFASNKENEKELTSGSEMGFNQLLADGAAVTAKITLDWARFLTGDPRTSLISVLSATITQPLLRGRGRAIAQEDLTQAERRVLYQIRTFNRYRKTFVVSIVTSYYKALLKKNEVANAQNDYKRKVLWTKQLEMEAKNGRRNRFEVDQAQQSELAAKDSFGKTQREYKEALDKFKIELALSTNVDFELDPNELMALEKGVTEPDYTLKAAIETALLRRLDLANSEEYIEDAARQAMIASDNLGAELNFIAGIGTTATGRDDVSRFRFGKDEYSLGLQSDDLPFDRLSERNAYRRALITLTQTQRQHEDNLANVELEVRQAYRQLIEAAQRYRIQKISLDLAKKRVDSTPMLLKTGRASTRDLLESQNALLGAQNDVASALVDHAVAKLNFFQDIGILQVRPDGMWER